MLKIENLTKTFDPGTVNEKRVINHLDINVKEGDFISIIGGNGSGKSTLLNLIGGVFPSDTGKIILDGEEVQNMPEHKRAKYLGRVFQDPLMGTAANMQLEENLALAYRRGKKRGLSWFIRPDERKIYKERLATLGLGLENRMRDKIGLLSGGQRQSVTLLMATLNSPKLLLLDEHTAALDPKTADIVLKLTDQIIQKQELTAMMVTHNMQDAIDHGNRLVMMDAGKIIYDVRGEEKKQLKVQDLLNLFQSLASEEPSDRMLLD
ncbi:MAG: ABC transporter ATP-binding protein [Clostridiaceae bacterium]|nr:ABC transporter ATP-binding protein [Clostridiaceae bacterium]